MKFVSALSLLAAAVAASEAETDTEADFRGPLYNDNVKAQDYLSPYNAYVPRAEDFTHGQRARAVRGDIKVSRRRPEKSTARLEGELVERKDLHKGRTYDWREYEPDLHGGKDPYADCKFPEETKHLDTPEYQAMSAKCKEELIWQKILSDGTRQKFFVGPEFQSLFDQDMNLSYDVQSDTMPINRKKVTHPVGSHAKMEFIPHPDSPYTGIYRGAKHVIMRISDTVKSTPEIAKTVPGHAVKFLRDGMHSANWVTMFSFDGQTSFNFFKNRWTTILREPNNKCARATIAKHLSTVTDHIGATSTMDLAQWDQYGNKEENPNWPYQVDVEPYDVFGWTDEYQNDFQDQLLVIPMNTVMFRVMAFDEPPELGGKDRLAGWLVSRSDQIDSLWGDDELFFKHQRMDDDIVERPHYFDWLQFFPGGKFNETPLDDPAPPVKCPFFFLFEKAALM